MDLNLLWQKLVHRRGGLTKDEEWQLRNNDLGTDGELWLLHYLEGRLPQHWIVQHNIWLKGPMQLDVLIINEAGIFNINAKNYQSHYRYAQNRTYFNGTANRTDIFARFKTSMEKLELIHQQIGTPGSLGGMIAFVNPDFSVEIDETAACKWYCRNQLSFMVDDLMTAAANVPVGYEIDIHSTYQKLMRYEIDFPFELPLCSASRFARMRKGIDCARCHRFDVNLGLRMVHCACGHIEKKREAVVRVICEYGVIFHERELQVTEVCEIFGGQVERRYVAETLGERFELLVRGRKAKYRNPKALYTGEIPKNGIKSRD